MDEVCGTPTSVLVQWGWGLSSGGGACTVGAGLVQCVLMDWRGSGVRQVGSLDQLSVSYVSTWWITLPSIPLLVS